MPSDPVTRAYLNDAITAAAAYAKLTPGMTTEQIRAALSGSNQDVGLTFDQATAFTNRFEIVATNGAPPGKSGALASGLQAMLLKENGTDKYYLVAAGASDARELIAAHAQTRAYGYAIDQYRDYKAAVNRWLA